MFNAVLCRYHEIAIKGNNRREFERQLVGNMRYMFKKQEAACKVRHIRGRIWVEPAEQGRDFSENELQVISDILSRTFGLESYSPAKLVKPEMAEIIQAVREVAPPLFAPYLENGGKAVFNAEAREDSTGGYTGIHRLFSL